MPIIRTDARRLYQCDCCEKTDVWGDSWAWFGSYRQLEDVGLEGVKDVIVICSSDCRVKMVADSRLPSEGIDDDGNVIEQPDVPQQGRRRSGRSRMETVLESKNHREDVCRGP